MKLMTLSQICKKFGFSRRVIQGYEKEGLIKHSSKNKYGHLMYDEKQIKKIAYIRYLQLNGYSLKEISNCCEIRPGSYLCASLLKTCNYNLIKRMNKIKKLIESNNYIIEHCMGDDYRKKEKEVIEIIMEEIKNEKTI